MSATRKSLTKPRTSLLNNKKKNANSPNAISLITPYSPVSGKLFKILNIHWHTLTLDDTLHHLLPNTPRITHKRAKTIRQHICHSFTEVKPEQPTTTELPSLPQCFYNCGQCNVCFCFRQNQVLFIQHC